MCCNGGLLMEIARALQLLLPHLQRRVPEPPQPPGLPSQRQGPSGASAALRAHPPGCASSALLCEASQCHPFPAGINTFRPYSVSAQAEVPHIHDMLREMCCRNQIYQIPPRLMGHVAAELMRV